MKPFLKIPEGAPFWKYNVKDAVICAPVKTNKFSSSPEAGHLAPGGKESSAVSMEPKCGRIGRRLEALEQKYIEMF